MASDQKIISFLFSPCLSKYDDMENTILYTYLIKSISQTFQKARSDITVYNLLLDTPWNLYRYMCLANRAGVTDPVTGRAHIVLTFALTAIVLYLCSKCNFVVMNANGPVINEGITTLIGYLSAMGMPIVPWKDDARRLYGGRDNPFVIGMLPLMNQWLLYGPDRLMVVDPQHADKPCNPDSTQTSFSLILSGLGSNGTFNTRRTPVVQPRFQYLIEVGERLYKATYANAKFSGATFKIQYEQVSSLVSAEMNAPGFRRNYPLDYASYKNFKVI